MKLTHFVQLCLVSILLGMAIQDCSPAGPIKAFSLREADRLLRDGSIPAEELNSLGGMTRFVGMVYDREDNDIILVGKVREDLPAVTIDDLAVALRCRLLSGQYPCVSIDMTEATAETGVQEVRFVGDIEQTQFGSDFLQSDVILKRYSLDLLQSVEGVMPYLKQYEADVVTSLEIDGRPVQEVQWLSEEDSRKKAEEYEGRDAVPGRTVQSRFWFHVIDDDSYIVEQDDVYVIEELRLGVKAETMQSEVNVEIEGTNATDMAAEEFSRQFTEHYHEVCDANPALKRLKAMFDLVCIAEGVANLGNDRPRLDALLSKYSVRSRETPREYSLVHRVGEVKCESGDVVLCQLSGGISLEAVLMALEDGDVSGLKLAVLGTRPSEDALCWTLPLDEWVMPNNEPEEAGGPNAPLPQKVEVDLPGFSLAAQSYIFPKDKTGLETSAFTGFDAPASTSPLQESRPQLQRHKRLTISNDNAKLQEALLSKDWERIVDLLQNVDVKTTDPILRFVKAHACLATNRNNESVGLFSVTTLADLATCLQWCQKTAAEEKNGALASYFLGDVYAKYLDYETAIKYFTEAIDRDETDYLAFSARGAVYVVLGEYDKAIKDLIRARILKSDFADVYNTLAMINIRQRKGLIANSKRTFQAVLEVNPDFALAYHGLGCIELLEAKERAVPEENENMQHALELQPDLMGLFVANEALYSTAVIDKQAETLYANAGSEGTSLQRQYQLIGAIQDVDTAQRNLDTSPFWARGTARRRLDQANLRVTNTINAMRTEDIRQTSPYIQARAQEVVRNTHSEWASMKSRANSSGRIMQAQSGALEWGGRALSLLRIPQTEVLTGTLDGASRVSSYNASGYRRSASLIDPVLERTGAADSKMTAVLGNVPRFSMPDQTQRGYTQRAIQQAGRLHSSSPEGYSQSLNVQRNYPGARPGGATTDKALIVWNDGEWPFEPILGLLYQVPQDVDGDQASIGKEQ